MTPPQRSWANHDTYVNAIITIPEVVDAEVIAVTPLEEAPKEEGTTSTIDRILCLTPSDLVEIVRAYPAHATYLALGVITGTLLGIWLIALTTAAQR